MRQTKPADSNDRPLTASEIATFVRAKRDANGWSQETLAELSGLNVRTVQRVEDGQPSSTDTRRAIARAFDFSDLDLFNKPMPVPNEVQIRELLDECERLKNERELLRVNMEQLNKRVETTQTMLDVAAARDGRWLHLVRTTMMPKQPGRVPFHNAAEVALRGYHCSMREKPVLNRVTWSPLPYHENGLCRGYHAGLILTGSHFAPGVAIAKRFKGAPENGAPDLSQLWQQPSIYFGDHLELAASVEPDGPVSWRGMEFCVRGPEGRLSEWIEFSYVFDDDKLLGDVMRYDNEGRAALDRCDFDAAVEPLRRAMVISRGLFGWQSEKYRQSEAIWNLALDTAALNRLRFREGATLRIVAGPHEGRSGKVEKILLRHFHAYVINVGQEEVQAADNQVECT
ncbi:helix-turn-helix domain-containing protein [Rhizobium sp. P40RR-XXII]|uniref:helix-turn-helix domain-containing protein n=1 Tax=Rhizobium sp. P40RR-XXII TaxID=2726739 RepID=UPI001456CAB1|nr:helix-turn-helix domain-containing protein [Rhizobium sp. P40RR-XXII]NLS20320.1 helix-turn-helix domain-containing protein [Rhizobium sp. P40RR-XXII]